jgi:hypothetical protein
VTRLLGTLILGIGIGLATDATAQTTAADKPAAVRENVSGGVTFGGGSLGGLVTFRVSAPMTRRGGVDFDLGHITGNGSTYGAQLRYQFRPRSVAGGSGYVLLGVSHVNLESRTEVRWPGGVVTYLTQKGPSAIPHLGIGGDWVTPEGVRVGFEVTSGGGEWMVVNAKMMILWGPARH